MGIHTYQPSAVTPLMPMPVLAGQMGVFGTGQAQTFLESGSFKVPPGISRIRVRVVGGGGSGYIPGFSPIAGGVTSFGSLISAGGGGAGVNTSATPAGGTGTGGDFQAAGGSTFGAGGAGSGSQLGKGGSSYSNGGAGVGGGSSRGSCGGSAYGIGTNLSPGLAADGSNSLAPSGAFARFPFDVFPGAGGSALSGGGSNGGQGAGAGAASNDTVARHGGPGGGGALGQGAYGNGGIGGGGASQQFNYKGGAGGGYAHGVFDVAEGTTYVVTVSSQAVLVSGQETSLGGWGGAGICIVEW